MYIGVLLLKKLYVSRFKNNNTLFANFSQLYILKFIKSLFYQNLLKQYYTIIDFNEVDIRIPERVIIHLGS